MRAGLPSGPSYPAAIQGIGFWTRPLAFLERCRARYGKRFTIRLPLAPPFVMLTDPAEVKQVFTAPPDVLHPGEGARVLEPVVGSNSVILLDEGAHMEQRKLMLPAFHGERMERLSGLMAEVAEREVGELAARRRRSSCTRACSGSRSRSSCARSSGSTPARASTRCASGSRRCSPSATGRSACVPIPPESLAGRILERVGPFVKFVRLQERGRQADLRADRRAPPRGAGGRRHPRDAARGAPRGRLADVRPGAPRRADDAAGGRPRDHRLDARLGLRAPPAPPRGARRGCARRSTRATATPTSRRRSRRPCAAGPVLPNVGAAAHDAADRGRRLRATRRASAWCRTPT